MIASTAWHTSATAWHTSAQVLTLVAAGAGIIGVAFAFVTWLIGPPGRRLVYSIYASTPLLNSKSPYGIDRSRLQVVYDQHNLFDPYVVTLYMKSKGHRAIESKDFDQSKPIIFDIGSPVVTPLGVERNFHFEGHVSGTTVQISPTLIRKGDFFYLHLLIDGPPGDLVRRNPMPNVKMLYETIDKQESMINVPVHVPALLLAIFLSAVCVYGAVAAGAPFNTLNRWSVQFGVFSTLSVASIIAVVTIVVILVRRSLIDRDLCTRGKVRAR